METGQKKKVPLDSLNIKPNGLFYEDFLCQDDLIIYVKQLNYEENANELTSSNIIDFDFQQYSDSKFNELVERTKDLIQ